MKFILILLLIAACFALQDTPVIWIDLSEDVITRYNHLFPSYTNGL